MQVGPLPFTHLGQGSSERLVGGDTTPDQQSGVFELFQGATASLDQAIHHGGLEGCGEVRGPLGCQFRLGAAAAGHAMDLVADCGLESTETEVESGVAQ